MEVGDVRQILLDIKAFDRTKKGMVETDYGRADSLLEKSFTEKRATQHEVLSDEDVNALVKSFSDRFEDDTVCDITTHPEGHSKYWIDLAKKLASLKRVKRTSELSKSKDVEARFKNAWELLIPTLEEKHLEPITRESFAALDIRDLLLSDDGRQLLSVRQAFENAIHNDAVFCFQYDGKSRRFTLKERLRVETYKKDIVIEYPPRVAHLLDYQRHLKEQPRITKETVLALKKLAEGSASQKGIGYEINDPDLPEYLSAAKAYEEFREYLEKITEEEQKALGAQIVWSSQSRETTFAQEYDNTVKVNPTHIQLCTTLVAFSWAKLVMEYMPDVVFDNPVLEEKKIENGWAFDTVELTESDRIPFIGFDQDREDKTYYKKSCLKLMIYLMSNQFNVAPFLGGETITFKGQTNQSVPSSASKMLALLENAFDEAVKNPSQALQLYKRAHFNLLYYIVEPALNKPSPTRYSDTQLWLESLQNKTFWAEYDKDGSVDFEQSDLGPKLLFFISSYKSDKLKNVGKLHDEIMRLAAKEAPYNEASIQLAIIAKQLQSKFSDGDVEVLQLYLSGKSTPFSEQKAGLFLKENIIQRYLYHLSFKDSNRVPGNFFKAGRESNEELFVKLQAVFVDIQAAVPPSASVQSIIEEISTRLLQEKLTIAHVGRKQADKFLKSFDPTYLNAVDAALVEEQEDEVVPVPIYA